MLYIVRHCDKDNANGCSAEGYDSAVRWKDFFNNMNLKNPIFFCYNYLLFFFKKYSYNIGHLSSHTCCRTTRLGQQCLPTKNNNIKFNF
jgi:hypothetical protein